LARMQSVGNWWRWKAKHHIDVVVRWWWGATKFGMNLIGVATFFFIVSLFYKTLFDTSIAIEPISVPKPLQESGYSPDVASKHLRDALMLSIERASKAQRLQKRVREPDC